MWVYRSGWVGGRGFGHSGRVWGGMEWAPGSHDPRGLVAPPGPRQRGVGLQKRV